MKKLNDIKAKLQFWWAKHTLKDGRDFSLSFDALGLKVTVLRGNFSGVQYRYSPLKVREEEEGLVDFATIVVYNPEKADVSDPAFQKLTTNILRILLANAVGEHELSIKEQVIDENRNTDTVELDQEREFHEEVSPLLEKRVSKRKPRKKVVSADSGVHSEVQQSAKPKRARARTSGKKRPDRK